MTKFLLIRHATNDTVGIRIAGRMTGVHLNVEGTLQAQALAQRLSHLTISAIYSSPLERATETAEPVAKHHNLITVSNDDFLEIEFGEWTNCTLEEIKKEQQFGLFNSFRSCTRIPGGETMLEAQVRIVTGLQKLSIQHPDETVAIVTHGDLIKAAIAYYAGIHLDLFQRIEISPASVSVVRIFNETVQIVQVNNTGEIQT